MSDRHVFCGGLEPTKGRRNALRLDANAPPGSPAKINLALGALSKRLADHIPDVLTDLLEIAAYVYCADQFTQRGTPQMARMGEAWRRRFRFQMPVRCPGVWAKPEVHDALSQTLGFLSEDEFDFEFVQGSRSPPLQAYLPFGDDDRRANSPEQIILFSGGLDSLAGAVEAIMSSGKSAALVSHQASKMIRARQDALVAGLKHRSGAAVPHVPVVINKGHERAADFTQRTRSFMFATLGLIVARMFGRDELSFYENGVVSLNLPLAEHVLGARASRTTHPRFISDCSRLFSLLLSEPFTIQNPYIWKTKTEVVRVLGGYDCADLISTTLSCTRIREATQTGQHCGVCSQCIDRRFGVLAAGMAAFDPPENYAADLLSGACEPGPALTMVESYVLRAQKLATMSEQAFVAAHGQIFRALPYLPGAADLNARRIWELHQRHGREVVSVINEALRERSSVAAVLDLPPNSLLAMVSWPIALQPQHSDPVEAEPTASAQAAADTHEYGWNRIVIGLDAENRRVVFGSGIELGHGTYDLFAALLEQFEADLAAAIAPAAHEYVEARALAARLKIQEPSLRQRVARARREIADAFLKKLDRELDIDDVIENREWKGYRLNPNLLLVAVSQLRQPAVRMSQVSKASVTSPPSPH